MGAFYWPIAVGDPQGQRFEELQALVDTGATWTWVPRDVLERLGHQATLRRRFRTADNRIIEREAAEVPIRLMGLGDETLTNLCVFGDAGSEVLLGVATMENFSVAPDPVNKRLVSVAGLLMTMLQ